MLQFDDKYTWRLSKVKQGCSAYFMGDSFLGNYGWEIDPEDVVLDWVKEIKSPFLRETFPVETLDALPNDLIVLSLRLDLCLEEEMRHLRQNPIKEEQKNQSVRELFELTYTLAEKENKIYYFMEFSRKLYILEMYSDYYFWRPRLADKNNLMPTILLGGNDNRVNEILPDKVILWINSLSGNM